MIECQSELESSQSKCREYKFFYDSSDRLEQILVYKEKSLIHRAVLFYNPNNQLYTVDIYAPYDWNDNNLVEAYHIVPTDKSVDTIPFLSLTARYVYCYKGSQMVEQIMFSTFGGVLIDLETLFTYNTNNQLDSINYPIYGEIANSIKHYYNSDYQIDHKVYSSHLNLDRSIIKYLYNSNGQLMQEVDWMAYEMLPFDTVVLWKDSMVSVTYNKRSYNYEEVESKEYIYYDNYGNWQIKKVNSKSKPTKIIRREYEYVID